MAYNVLNVCSAANRRVKSYHRLANISVRELQEKDARLS